MGEVVHLLAGKHRAPALPCVAETSRIEFSLLNVDQVRRALLHIEAATELAARIVANSRGYDDATVLDGVGQVFQMLGVVLDGDTLTPG